MHDDEKCYCKDTIKHLQENEKKFLIEKIKFSLVHSTDQDYANYCPFSYIRKRLIEWMVSIQDYFANCEETLEMATRLFDHMYFKELNDSEGQKLMLNSNNPIELIEAKVQANILGNMSKCECVTEGLFSKESLQLVALSCYYLSCKFWERFPPKLSKLAQLANFEYSEMHLLHMERTILTKLEFDLKIPLISQYLEFYMLHETRFFLTKIIIVCHYLLNLTLTSTIFLNRSSSTLAAAILTLSKMILSSFSAHDNSSIGYDQSLFEIDEFYVTLDSLWCIFSNSISNKDSYKLQKKKFSHQKYNFFSCYLERVDVAKLSKKYQELSDEIKNYLFDKSFHDIFM